MAINNRKSRNDLMFILKNLQENRQTCIANRTINGNTSKYIVLKINHYKLK